MRAEPAFYRADVDVPALGLARGGHLVIVQDEDGARAIVQHAAPGGVLAALPFIADGSLVRLGAAPPAAPAAPGRLAVVRGGR
jgi:hypothetical protein